MIINKNCDILSKKFHLWLQNGIGNVEIICLIKFVVKSVLFVIDHCIFDGNSFKTNGNVKELMSFFCFCVVDIHTPLGIKVLPHVNLWSLYYNVLNFNSCYSARANVHVWYVC